MARRKSAGVTILPAPSPTGRCQTSHRDAFGTRKDAEFAGAVHLRGDDSNSAIRVTQCPSGHFHFVRVTRLSGIRLSRRQKFTGDR